jgi:hypothetical protein
MDVKNDTWCSTSMSQEACGLRVRGLCCVGDL